MSRRILAAFALAALPLPSLAAAPPTGAPRPAASPSLSPSSSAAPLGIPSSLPRIPGVDPTWQRTAEGVVRGIIQQQQQISHNTAHGPVSYVRGRDLQIVVGHNTYRDIRMGPKTIVNPRGATIRTGDVVDVQGRGKPDGTLDADRVTIIRP